MELQMIKSWKLAGTYDSVCHYLCALTITCDGSQSLWPSSYSCKSWHEFFIVWPPNISWRKLVSVKFALVIAHAQGCTEMAFLQLASKLRFCLATHYATLCAQVGIWNLQYPLTPFRQGLIDKKTCNWVQLKFHDNTLAGNLHIEMTFSSLLAHSSLGFLSCISAAGNSLYTLILGQKLAKLPAFCCLTIDCLIYLSKTMKIKARCNTWPRKTKKSVNLLYVIRLFFSSSCLDYRQLRKLLMITPGRDANPSLVLLRETRIGEVGRSIDSHQCVLVSNHRDGITGVAQWWERSTLTNVSRVWFLDPVSYVGLRCFETFFSRYSTPLFRSPWKPTTNISK